MRLIPGVPKRPVPSWLMDLRPVEPVRAERIRYWWGVGPYGAGQHGPRTWWVGDVYDLPLGDMLKDSLYYPVCGPDGDPAVCGADIAPVECLAGLVHSFVFADGNIGHDAVIRGLDHPSRQFAGYSVFARRDIFACELVCPGILEPPAAPVGGGGRMRRWRGHGEEPFAVWSIYQRNGNVSEEHGPERFSLLYVFDDGVAAFKRLYLEMNSAPEVVAIVQPAIEIAANWMDFGDPAWKLGETVLGNPSGRPRYILYGGWGLDYRPCCWGEYVEEVRYWSVPNRELGLWKRS